MTDDELIARAIAVTGPRRPGPSVEMGTVGAALLTPEGEVFCGACLDAACGVGFCAEHAAVAALVTAGGSRVAVMVAVSSDGGVMPPCGRCRELIRQVDPRNAATRVLLPGGHARLLGALLPEWWLPSADAP